MAGEIDAFLYFGRALKGGKPTQIDGETTDAIEREDSGGFGKSMAIQQYSIDFAHPMDHTEEMKNQSDGSQMHEPDISSISVTKLVDAASPMLLRALWEGTQYKDAWISQRKAGGAKGKSGDYFWQIELQEVAIENLTWSADAGGQTTETIKLHANKGIFVQYFKQKPSGDQVTSAIEYQAVVERPHAKKNGADNMTPSQTDAIVKEVIKRLDKRPQSSTPARPPHR
jgi:type VI protein secretion system component Hcp